VSANPPDSGDIHAQIRDRLSHGEHRYTRSRRRLVEAVVRAGRPVTLPEILEHEPDLAQSSAYRNLDVLEQCGVVRRITVSGDHAHFELTEPLLEHHHHLICDGCGAITDVHLDDELERLVDRNLAAAADAAGFTPLRHSLDLHGLCADCSH
jgi:Fe2+ or Zn2+ uptake regulation protein